MQGLIVMCGIKSSACVKMGRGKDLASRYLKLLKQFTIKAEVNTLSLCN